MFQTPWIPTLATFNFLAKLFHGDKIHCASQKKVCTYKPIPLPVLCEDKTILKHIYFHSNNFLFFEVFNPLKINHFYWIHKGHPMLTAKHLWWSSKSQVGARWWAWLVAWLTKASHWQATVGGIFSTQIHFLTLESSSNSKLLRSWGNFIHN